MIEGFLAGAKVLVRAPAGCGKTHLLIQAVGKLEGRQLVLTHTNAGVRELRKRLDTSGIDRGKYSVKTVDSFAFAYAAAYRTASGLADDGMPQGPVWDQVKEAFLRLLQHSFVRRVITASYAGVLIDEYQDCSIVQHEIAMTLSELLPVRIVGDPMQAIFDFGKGRNGPVSWEQVERDFVLVGELDTPHRWSDSNIALGHWIQKSRARLAEGKLISRDDSVSIYRESTTGNLVSHLRSIVRKYPHDSVAVIYPTRRSSCWALAGRLGNFYQVLEDADCRDLVSAATVFDLHIEKGEGPELLLCLSGFLRKYVANLPSPFKGWAIRIAAGNVLRNRKSESARITLAMLAVARDANPEAVEGLVNECASIPRVVFRSHEMWSTLRRALQRAASGTTFSLAEEVRLLRHQDRLVGRRPPFRCVSTTLLLKGMEFDRVVVPDYKEFAGDPKRLYVAISRPKKSLDIFIMK